MTFLQSVFSFISKMYGLVQGLLGALDSASTAWVKHRGLAVR